MTESHREFGIHCEDRPSKSIDAIADTGCQTSTCGVDTLKMLNIPERYLIPTSHGIVGITDTRLQILGTVMMAIRYNGRKSRQMVYVSANAAGLYLSEKALSDLGVIDGRFPSGRGVIPSEVAVINTADNEEGTEDDCKCIPRSLAPDAPEKIPHSPTRENKEKLKAWLSKNFESSAFNTCTHQPLQEMTGNPMKFHFKDKAQD